MSTNPTSPAVIESLAVSIKQATAMTSLARSTLYTLASEGRIAMFKVGNRTLIKTESLKALIAGMAPAHIRASHRPSA